MTKQEIREAIEFERRISTHSILADLASRVLELPENKAHEERCSFYDPTCLICDCGSEDYNKIFSDVKKVFGVE